MCADVRRNLTPRRREHEDQVRNISKSHAAYWNLSRGHREVWHNLQDIWKLRSPKPGSRGVLERWVDVCYSLLSLRSIKEGRTQTPIKRQSALNYKSLQAALCARCCDMRRHLSCFSVQLERGAHGHSTQGMENEMFTTSRLVWEAFFCCLFRIKGRFWLFCWGVINLGGNGQLLRFTLCAGDTDVFIRLLSTGDGGSLSDFQPGNVASNF